MVVYVPPQQVESLTFFMGAMKAVIPGFTGLPSDPPPLPFQVADPERLRQRLADAGLNDIRIETITESLEFQSGKHMWDWVTNSNSIGRMLVSDLMKEQEAMVQQVLHGMLRERSGGSGTAVLTNPIHIATGTK